MSLSDRQWAVLGLLLLRPQSLGELRARWPQAERTVIGLQRHRLVELYRGEKVFAPGDFSYGRGTLWVRITALGLRYFGTPEQTAGLGTFGGRR